MELLSHLLAADASAPRLTVYNETTGARMDFSAQTLDNWAAKIANMLAEELELDEESTILIDLPVSWQAAVIVLGALARDVTIELADSATHTVDSATTIDAVFTSPEHFEVISASYPGADVVLVTDDAFGRGVAETGGDVPDGAIDFGPTVRFYGDEYFEPTAALPELVAPLESPERLLSTGWAGWASFSTQVLAPLAAGGSAVVVTGEASPERLDSIAANEKVTARA